MPLFSPVPFSSHLISPLVFLCFSPSFFCFDEIPLSPNMQPLRNDGSTVGWLRNFPTRQKLRPARFFFLLFSRILRQKYIHRDSSQMLFIGAAFKPANECEGKWVALPFRSIFWVLFYFNLNISVCRPFLSFSFIRS